MAGEIGLHHKRLGVAGLVILVVRTAATLKGSLAFTLTLTRAAARVSEIDSLGPFAASSSTAVKDWQEGFRALLPNVNISFSQNANLAAGNGTSTGTNSRESVTWSAIPSATLVLFKLNLDSC